jgi:hypothetical protein
MVNTTLGTPFVITFKVEVVDQNLEYEWKKMASIIQKLKQFSKVKNSKVTNLSRLELVDVNMVTMYL